jgi:bifunctional non-homologous end joining protein LigD
VPGCEPGAFTVDTMPLRFGQAGDPWEDMDQAVGSLEPLLELAARDEAAGIPDAPWPPHFAKQEGEPVRAAPSRRRAPDSAHPAVNASGRGVRAGRRQSKMPLIEIARAAIREEALAGLERWKERYPRVWPLLAPADVLVDTMRGSSSTWTRIRLNLRNVPEAERPPQERLEVDYDPWERRRR